MCIRDRYILPRENQFVEPQPSGTGLLSTSHDRLGPKNIPETAKLYQPDWVRLDRHVLRFYGYFTESVVARNLENARNRKVKVHIYLEDTSISINE